MRARTVCGVLVRFKLAISIVVVIVGGGLLARPLLSEPRDVVSVADLRDPDPDHDEGAVTESIPDDDVQQPTASERARALAAAKVHEPVARLLRERNEPVLLRTYAPADGETGPCSTRRCIEVTFYLYRSNVVLDVLMSAAEMRVISTTSSRGQPPLSLAEQARAHRIADGDADLRAHLGNEAHVHAVLAYPMWRDTAPCDVDRCASVVYPMDRMLSEGIGRQATVVVDLSTLRIVERIYLTCTPDCEPRWS